MGYKLAVEYIEMYGNVFVEKVPFHENHVVVDCLRSLLLITVVLNSRMWAVKPTVGLLPPSDSYTHLHSPAEVNTTSY